MASKGQSVLKEKKLIPAKYVRTHLGAFERTHASRSTDVRSNHGRTQPAAGPSSYMRSNTSALRSNARPCQP
jgi:hypothetical protein